MAASYGTRWSPPGFDIVKPPPVRWADRSFKGGFGVMFDDLVAAGYTLLALAVLVALFGA